MTERSPERRFLDLELPVEVWLAHERVPLEQLLSLEPGDMLALDHDPDGPVDLVVNGSTVATGELVVVDGRFGFRVGATSRPGIDEVESRAAADAEAASGNGGGGTADTQATPAAPPANAPAADEDAGDDPDGGMIG